MGARLTEEEFIALIANNQNLSISQASVTDKEFPTPKPTLAKYKNSKVYVFADGYVLVQTGNRCPDCSGHGDIVEKFDSQKEYARYKSLLLLERAGKIQNLCRQKSLEIQPGFKYQGERIRPITYDADFVYEENGKTVVEDIKAIDDVTGKPLCTKDFKLKWKLLKFKYPAYVFRIE